MMVTVEVIDNKAFNLLSEMEHLDLIRLKIPIETAIAPSEKLSDRFAGALKLTDSEYETYQDALKEGRNEWDRDIY
ncbi:MAG: hypothetical protein FWC64_04010 [Treponema sp.]|nr:hypothetical protein [Treponema sp.]